MKKRWKRLQRIALIGIPLGILFLYVALQALLGSEWLHRQAEVQLGAKLGVPVRIGRLRAGLWGPIHVEGIQVAGFLGQPDFFDIGRVEIRYRYLELLRGRLGAVVLVRPRLHLEQDAQGQWNIPPSLLEESEEPFVIPQLDIEQGVATVRLADATYQLEGVNLALSPLPGTGDRRRLRLSFQCFLSGLPSPLGGRGELWQQGKAIGGAVVVSASEVEAAALGRLLRPHLPSDWALAQGEAGLTAHASYDPPEAGIQWTGRGEGLEIHSGTRSLALGRVETRGRVAARLGESLTVEELTVEATPLGQLLATASYDWAGGKLKKVALSAHECNLSELRGVLRDWLPPSLGLGGVLGLEAKLQGTSKDRFAWQAHGGIQEASLAWDDLCLAISALPSETAASGSPALDPLEFRAAGGASLSSLLLSLDSLELDWGEALSATARACLAMRDETYSASGTLELQARELSPLLDGLRRRLDEQGVRQANGKVEGSSFFDVVHGVPAAATVALSLSQGELLGDFGEASGLTLAVRGTLKERERIEGVLNLSAEKVSGERFDVEGVAFELDARASSFRNGSGDLSFAAAKAGVRMATEGSLSVHQLKGRAMLEGDLGQGRWRLDRCLLEGEGLPEVRLEAALAMNNPRTATVEMETGTMDWAQLYAAWESDLPEAYRGWLADGTGTLALSASLEQGPDRIWIEDRVKASLGSVSFFSADGLLAAGGLKTTLNLNSTVELAHETPGAAASASFPSRIRSLNWSGEALLEGQEVLYGTVYQELSGLRATLDTQGRWLPGQDRLEELQTDLQLQPLGRVRLAGSAAGLSATPSVDVQLDAERLDLGQVHQRFAQEGGLREAIPALGRWETEGRVDATVECRGSLKDWEVEGVVRMSDGLIGSRAEPIVIVSGFALDLPFQVALHQRESRLAESPPVASIRYEQMVLGPLTLGAQDIPFTLYNNDFEIPRPVSIPFYEGQLELRELALEDFLAAGKRLRFDIQLKDVQLAPIARDAQLPPLSGTISAHLPRFDTIEEDLVAEGPARLEVFKGTVDVTGLRVDDLLGVKPTVRLSADFHDIDLYELSTVLQYGRASGIIEGYLREFAASPSGAEHFLAEVRSVRRSGIPQRISAEMVEIIAAVGKRLSAAERALLYNKDDYGYRQLGLWAKLENGRLYTMGTVDKNDKELVLAGSPFDGININFIDGDKGNSFDAVLGNIMTALQAKRSR